MRILSGKSATAYVREIEQRGSRLDEVEPAVRQIVEEVRREGDRALLKYARRFDALAPKQSLRVSDSELRAAWKSAPAPLRKALGIAEKNIRRFSRWQKPKAWNRSKNSVSLGQLVRPLDSCGCYVPGGRFPLLSTLLMTVIPAQVAGVKNIRVVSPHPSSEVLAAAALLGVNEFYRVGGAQAIAALAYGTETVARVDKITGPGNKYVAAAKKLVFGVVGIDSIAGPSEVVIIADDSARADFVAADLLAQAEHGEDSSALLITTSEALAETVIVEVQRQVESLSRRAIVRRSLADHGAIVIVDDWAEACAIVNELAPEHLEIVTSDDESIAEKVRHAGAIFFGSYTP